MSLRLLSLSLVALSVLAGCGGETEDLAVEYVKSLGGKIKVDDRTLAVIEVGPFPTVRRPIGPFPGFVRQGKGEVPPFRTDAELDQESGRCPESVIEGVGSIATHDREDVGTGPESVGYTDRKDAPRSMRAGPVQ